MCVTLYEGKVDMLAATIRRDQPAQSNKFEDKNLMSIFELSIVGYACCGALFLLWASLSNHKNFNPDNYNSRSETLTACVSMVVYWFPLLMMLIIFHFNRNRLQSDDISTGNTRENNLGGALNSEKTL